MTQIEWTHLPGFKGESWNPTCGYDMSNDLTIPLRARKPRAYFISPKTDLFADCHHNTMIDQVFAVMALAPQHRFIVQTKRPQRMRDYLRAREDQIRDEAFDRLTFSNGRDRAEDWETNKECRWPLANVWLGVSVEDQASADERIPLLLDTPAAIRFISAEPLLGPIDLKLFPRDLADMIEPVTAEHVGELAKGAGRPLDVQIVSKQLRVLDWVITGGESGSDARPMHPDWHPAHVQALRRSEGCGMTEPVFIRAELVERLTLPHPTMAWPWAEIRIGRIDDEWFVGHDYNLPDGGGGASPIGYWSDWPSRTTYASRADAVSAGIAELRRRIGDRAHIAKKHLDWLDEIEAGLRQPSLFGEAA